MGTVITTPEGECDFCGLPYPDEETRETMPAGDPDAKRFCWSNEDNAKFCPQDPRHPDAVHKANCGCPDCRACAGDAEYDRARDDELLSRPDKEPR